MLRIPGLALLLISMVSPALAAVAAPAAETAGGLLGLTITAGAVCVVRRYARLNS